MTRRADGELELEILHILWNSSVPLQTAEVQERLTTSLAYTSVATVLSRLVAKELVQRHSSGRSFSYEATQSHDDWYAGRMLDLLRQTSNHRALLAGFVDKLSSRDRAALKALLEVEDR